MTDLITNYLACWNEADSDARHALIDQCWSEAAWPDPMTEVAGRAALNATISAVQQQFPGWSSPVGNVDVHHNQARFQWELGPAGAEPVVIGFDVVVTDAHGRIERVLDFLDHVPE
ncbi:nuclear transport factor 2 family protein [Jatrophihabitans lederbergiae]|uniref:Nuclear transport factor 2 family protein n=1 Tax=Jatrophihabitans lederbergiae TaxID=3075547 RepID=A0ABU2JAT9_9ACTN|nr:nuclear transport factor 2 family protein [Jatrophihabitans sp. DSM 44399]MDT0262107.1 nuclear transport factor 2 family protein [Jatrophihabitans sp. DSM 44399]